MAYNKKTWKARQGLGLNKFSIDGATPVPIINQPDSVTQQGDALSAGNLNDLEQRIADAFDDVEESKDVLKEQIDQHESRIENLEQKAGDYTTVQYRGTDAVPTGKAKNGLVESIVGKSRAWNQLLGYTRQETKTVNGVSFTNNNDGSYTVSTDANGATADTFYHLYSYSPTVSFRGYAEHKYLMLGCPVGGSSSTYSLRDNYYAREDIGNGNIVTFGDRYITIGISVKAGTVITTPIKFVPIVRDLTLIFGAGNEPSTVAEALAQLPALGQYNAYDAGSLVDTVVSGVKSVGVNLFDKDGTFVDAYCDGSGVFYENYGTLNAKSVIIKVKSGQTYYFNTDNKNGGMQRCAFTREYPTIGDRIYNASGTNTYETYTNGSTVTVPTGFMYMIVTFFRSDVSNDGYDNVRNALCINVSDISINGQYYPYMTDTLSLSETVTLKSAGSVADELDVESGVITRKIIGVVDLGDLNWSYSAPVGANQFWNASIDDKNPKVESGYNTVPNAISSKYTSVAPNSIFNRLVDNSISMVLINSVAYVIVNASSLEQPSGDFIFELATPTTESIDPILDNFIEVEGGGTIDTVQTQTPVIDNSLDVGYLTV